MTVDRYLGFVLGNKYYHIQNYPLDMIRIIIYDNSTPEITYSTDTLSEATYTIADDENLLGMALDNTENIIYFVIKKDSDSKNYLVSYNISDDEFTVLSEFNVALMLDRNVHGSHAPFLLEKGFNISEDKIYQIPQNYNGRLNMISSFNFTDTIIAITDHYVIDDSGNIYEFVDLIAENYFSYLFLDYWKEDYPTLDMEYRSDKFSVEKGQVIQIIGYLSADDQDRLFKGTYNFEDDEIGSAPNGWTDNSAGGCTATIQATRLNHKNILQLHDSNNANKADIETNFSASPSDTIEFYWNTNDNTKYSYIDINEGSGNIRIQLIIMAGKFRYAETGWASWIDSGCAVINDFDHRHKIVYDCATDTFDWYIDGTKYVTGGTFVIVATNLDNIRVKTLNAHTDYYAYFDAFGLPGDVAYIEGDNQYIEEGGEKQVVFEGIVDKYTGRKIQMAKVLNQGSEMDEIEPTGDAGSVDTDGLIDGIIDDFHNYITKGTRQDGADLGTITLKGNKKSRKYFNQIKDFDGYTWALRPQGALDYDNGSVSTDVALLYEKDDHEDDPIWDVDTIPISSGTNQVIVKGKINPSTGVPYEGQYDDEADQQQFGIHKIVIIDALLDSNAKCLTKATAIGTREGGGYLTVQFSFRKPLLGVIYPHQTITFKYISEDIEVSQATYIVDGIGVDLLREVCFLQASTGLIFEYKSIEKELPEENAQKVEQNAETITTKATVYISASDPTVNEDVDSGYLDGDLWINSGDAGVFILIDNSSGAANWDELAKV